MKRKIIILIFKYKYDLEYGEWFEVGYFILKRFIMFGYLFFILKLKIIIRFL